MLQHSRFVVVLALGVLSAVGGIACTKAAPPARVAPADPGIDHELVGTAVPAWTTEAWLNSKPLTLEDLRGKVVLVRWFMGTSCPYCSATAPSLKKLHHEYGGKGLVVVGLYHHKEEHPLTNEEYEGFVKSFGFDFPVARDPEWATLQRWWLRGHDRDFTSVSFLLDKAGRVRGIHPGGRYAPGEPAFDALKRGIERLLEEGG